MIRSKEKLSYLVTVSMKHVLPAKMLLRTLIPKTTAKIVLVGNVEPSDAQTFRAMGAEYIDEREIDLSSRLPKITWDWKYRFFGWYFQHFIRLSIDRFMTSEQVVVLDSEVFVFDNWDESRFYDQASGRPRCFYWIPSKRKDEWEYKMYR